jgi:hypothetical protein
MKLTSSQGTKKPLKKLTLSEKHRDLIRDAQKSNIGLASDSTLKEYAEVVESKNTVKDSSDKRNKLKQFCIVAMWKFDANAEQWNCYRMFKVEDPVLLESKFAENSNQR